MIPLQLSLSARRAWIEIYLVFYFSFDSSVALRKESVDRNVTSARLKPIEKLSLSARRAWIEI